MDMFNKILLFFIIGISANTAVAQYVVASMPAAPQTVIERSDCPKDYVWLPNHWEWDAEVKSYVWVEGGCTSEKKGHLWVRGVWRKVKEGWVYIPGRWKKLKS